jgi:hypothetical protein
MKRIGSRGTGAATDDPIIPLKDIGKIRKTGIPVKMKTLKLKWKGDESETG